MKNVLIVSMSPELADMIKTFTHRLADMQFRGLVGILAMGNEISESGPLAVFVVKATDEAKSEIVNLELFDLIESGQRNVVKIQEIALDIESNYLFQSELAVT